MNGWNRNRVARLWAFLFCAILMLTPMAVSENNESYVRSGINALGTLILAKNGAATPAPSPEAQDAGAFDDLQEEEPSAEDTELTQAQILALLESAALPKGETAEEYLDLPEAMEKEESSLSILLIGDDSRNMEKEGRSDTMILVSVNTKTGTVKMISFLRDMYVKIPGHGMNRLNAAYYYGGAPLLVQTLETNFGVHIDGTVAVNFSAMISIVDQLGGITLEVSERERAQINLMVRDFSKKGETLAKAGEQRLSGIQALCYSRIRKIDSDFQRTSRQHKVIEAMIAKMGEAEPTALAGLITGCWEFVKTDMTMADVSSLLPLLLNFGDVTFDTMHVPLDNAYYDDVVKGMMVLVPNLTKNSRAIVAFLED